MSKFIAKVIGYVIAVTIFVFMTIGVTYAMYSKSLVDVNIGTAAHDLDDYVIYTKGTNINSSTLEHSITYVNGASATITFYQSSDSPYNLYGHIHFDINSISDILTETEALKYTIVNDSNGAIVSEGSFYNVQDTKQVAYNIPLSTTNTTYTIYIWVDEDLYTDDIANSMFNIDIRCSATMKEKTLAASYITNLYTSAQKINATVNNVTYNLAPSVGLMNDRHATMDTGIDEGNVRYYGASPNNYVWLGDNYIEDHTFDLNGSLTTKIAGSKKLWRVIGVFDGRVKLVTADPINTRPLSWDASTSEVNSADGVNQWGPSIHTTDGSLYEGADLMRLLNPGYENDSSSNSLYWTKGYGMVYAGLYTSSYTTMHTSMSFANTGLSNIEKRMIDTATWYTGLSGGFVDSAYKSERGNMGGKSCSGGNWCNDDVKRTTIWEGKVGLMYPSDYLYAADLTTCNLQSYYYNNSACQNDWLRIKNLMFINPSYGSVKYADYVCMVDTSYALQRTSANVYSSSTHGVYPAIYLKPDVIITNGDGSESNPYVLTVG